MTQISNVEIVSVTKKHSDKKDKDYWVLKFKESIEGKKVATVFDRGLGEQVKDGDLINMEYTINGDYMNIADLNVVVTGQSVKQDEVNKVRVLEVETKLTPESAIELAGKVFNGLKEAGVVDPENRTMNTILIQLMKK